MPCSNRGRFYLQVSAPIKADPVVLCGAKPDVDGAGRGVCTSDYRQLDFQKVRANLPARQAQPLSIIVETRAAR
jgi:hypothetical protein